MIQIVLYEPAFALCNESEHMKGLSSARNQENSTEKTTDSVNKSDSVNVSTVKIIIITEQMIIAIFSYKKWTKYKTYVCPKSLAFLIILLVGEFALLEHIWYPKFIIRTYPPLVQHNNSLRSETRV